MRPLPGLAIAILLVAGCAPAGPPRATIPERPVEYPPLSYRGTTYVDSAGCAFVRAGDADTMVWVPQLTIDRRPVCGLPPSG
jgi:hypothetical protein